MREAPLKPVKETVHKKDCHGSIRWWKHKELCL